MTGNHWQEKTKENAFHIKGKKASQWQFPKDKHPWLCNFAETVHFHLCWDQQKLHGQCLSRPGSCCPQNTPLGTTSCSRLGCCGSPRTSQPLTHPERSENTFFHHGWRLLRKPYFYVIALRELNGSIFQRTQLALVMKVKFISPWPKFQQSVIQFSLCRQVRITAQKWFSKCKDSDAKASNPKLIKSFYVVWSTSNTLML